MQGNRPKWINCANIYRRESVTEQTVCHAGQAKYLATHIDSNTRNINHKNIPKDEKIIYYTIVCGPFVSSCVTSSDYDISLGKVPMTAVYKNGTTRRAYGCFDGEVRRGLPHLLLSMEERPRVVVGG